MTQILTYHTAFQGSQDIPIPHDGEIFWNQTFNGASSDLTNPNAFQLYQRLGNTIVALPLGSNDLVDQNGQQVMLANGRPAPGNYSPNRDGPLQAGQTIFGTRKDWTIQQMQAAGVDVRFGDGGGITVNGAPMKGYSISDFNKVGFNPQIVRATDMSSFDINKAVQSSQFQTENLGDYNLAEAQAARDKGLPAGFSLSNPNSDVTPVYAPEGTNTYDPYAQGLGIAPTGTYTSATFDNSVSYPTSNLVRGMEGAEVEQLQNWLVANGFMSPEEMATGPGIYGPRTEAAVLKLQQQLGIDYSSGPGQFGPITKNALQSAGGNVTINSGGSYQPGQTVQISGVYDPNDYVEGSIKFNQDGTVTGIWKGFDPSETGDETTGGTTGGGTGDGTTGGGSSPYFFGDYALVRFQEGGTIWFLDPTTKTLRPFENNAAVANLLEKPISSMDIEVISPSDLPADFQMLSPEYVIKADGTSRRLSGSLAELAARYGKPINEDQEATTMMGFQGMLDMFKLGDSGLSPETIAALEADEMQQAFYLNALVYGGYGIDDVYKDLKARELGIDGEIIPISAQVTKDKHALTQEGQEAAADTRVTPPQQIGNFYMSDYSLPIYQLPDELFKTLVPILDVNSPEFQEQVDLIESAYHDLLLQQVNANTEQEKAIADYNYQEFRNEMDRRYGIRLSNNAYDAWDQIQQAKQGFATAGITGSGIEREAIDDYLKRVRRSGDQLREEKLTQEESERRKYFLQFASPEEVQQLVNTNRALAEEWGLVPSSELASQLSIAALQEKYPDLDMETIERYRAAILDSNGNFRSGLYQKKVGDLLDQDPNNPNLRTTSGIEASKDAYQQFMTFQNALRDEEKAYREFTTPDVAFLRSVDESQIGDITPYSSESTVDYNNLTDLIKKARFGVSSEDTGAATADAGSTTGGTTLTPEQTTYFNNQISNIMDQYNVLKEKVNNYNTSGTGVEGHTASVDKFEVPDLGQESMFATSQPYSSAFSPLASYSTKTSTPTTTLAGTAGNTINQDTGTSPTKSVWSGLKSLFSLT